MLPREHARGDASGIDQASSVLLSSAHLAFGTLKHTHRTQISMTDLGPGLLLRKAGRHPLSGHTCVCCGVVHVARMLRVRGQSCHLGRVSLIR